MGNNRGNLSVPASWSAQERRFGESVKQNLDIIQGQRGDKLDRAVTFRDLLDTGLVTLARGVTNFDGNASSVAVVSDVANLDIPPAPTGLSANGAFQNIILTWNLKLYQGHSHVEVWSHTADVIASATLAAQVGGFTGTYADPVGPGVTRYYWVRAVNSNGITGPFNSSTGTQGQTAPDVTFLLTTLNQAITSSQLATTLSTEISDATTNITSLQNTYGSTAAAATSAAAAAASQAAALLNQQGAETAESNAETAETNAETAQAAAATSATAASNSATGAAGSASTAATHASTAATAATNAATSATAASTSATNAAASSTASSQSATASETAKTAAETAKSNAETAETNAATSATNASGSASSASTSATNAANSATAAGNSATAANTSASAASTSATNAGTSATAASGSQSAAATSAANASTSETNAATSETNAAGSATAAASTVNGLTARLNDVNNTGQGGTVTVEEAYSATATNSSDITSLEGQYTVKIDANGAVAGFGLASTSTSLGTNESEFYVNADRFAIMRGGSDTTAATTPFVVQATATTLNGVAVPAGVYMADAFIKNGAIVNAKIADAAIDNAKIDNLAAEKITSGKINTSRLEIDGATLTSTIIDGVATLVVNQLSANKITSDVLDTSRINLDGATITKDETTDAIKIKDLGVDTLSIAGNAVTIPSSSVLPFDVALTTSYQDIVSITWTSTGAPTVVFVVVEWDGSGNQGGYIGSGQLKHGSTVVQTFSMSGSNNVVYRRTMMMNITPSIGVNTVTCTGKEDQSFANSIDVAATNTSIFLLETKK